MNASQPPSPGAFARVLIVDDNRDAGKVLGLLLQRSGYEVEVLADGTECLSRLEAFQPAVLLLDIAMPAVSGYELARQIRARPEFEHLVVFAISGYADVKHVQWSLEAGCDRHLVKPVDLAALLVDIAHEVEKRPGAQPGICRQ